MTVWTYGSINADHFYHLPHLAAPGETVIATTVTRGLGGKGSNQSVAAARAGAKVFHIGSVGGDGLWACDRLASFGVDTSHVQVLDAPTGHAIISVAASGENAILVFGGANAAQTGDHAIKALTKAKPGDLLLLQNETPGVADAAKAGRAAGLTVLYSAAPFSLAAVSAVLPHAHILLMNALEAAQLADAGVDLRDSGLSGLVVTKGAEGAEWRDLASGETVTVAALPVDPVDTTGAGDTFAGYFAAGLDRGDRPVEAMRRASAAAALKVTRHGTADAIPDLAEVEAFLAAR